MNLISIDVGIKNLAICWFQTEIDGGPHSLWHIHKWEVINLTTETETETCSVCNKPAKFQTPTCHYFCAVHAKKQPFPMQNAKHTDAYFKKQNITSLRQIVTDNGLTDSLRLAKPDLIRLIRERINATHMTPIPAQVKAKDVDLFTIAKILTSKLSVLCENAEIHYVIIENQIGPLAIRMKTLQGMLTQFFAMHSSGATIQNIEFISSANKLKLSKVGDNVVKTDTYSDRKKQGIIQCLGMLERNPQMNCQIEFFNSHKKKDDLADSFLQGMWFIQNKVFTIRNT